MSVVCEYSDPSEMLTDEETCNVAVFQISYTTVFGAYSAFLFLRTGETGVAVSPVTKPLLEGGTSVSVWGNPSCDLYCNNNNNKNDGTLLQHLPCSPVCFQCTLDEGEKIRLI